MARITKKDLQESLEAAELLLEKAEIEIQDLTEVKEDLKTILNDKTIADNKKKEDLQKIGDMVLQYIGIDGSHHKNYALDQIFRLVKGAEYKEAVYDACFLNDKGESLGEDCYSWNTGIA
jgi:hypothetical protein